MGRQAFKATQACTGKLSPKKSWKNPHKPRKTLARVAVVSQMNPHAFCVVHARGHVALVSPSSCMGVTTSSKLLCAVCTTNCGFSPEQIVVSHLKAQVIHSPFPSKEESHAQRS